MLPTDEYEQDSFPPPQTLLKPALATEQILLLPQELEVLTTAWPPSTPAAMPVSPLKTPYVHAPFPTPSILFFFKKEYHLWASSTYIQVF